ncbi:MAG TPA: zinc-dependent metalloprotease family protein [Phycisphaerales bacterium]|nr:zinc-dependent metalloprotease family protein [Phycisphaerales bacterium]
MTSLSIDSNASHRFWRAFFAAFASVAILTTSAGAQRVIEKAGPWSVLDALPDGAAQREEWVHPVRGVPASLDVRAMREALGAAPFEETPRAATDPLVIALPDPDGRWQRFSIVEYSVMEPALAAAHPELRTYHGVGIDDPYANIRCSLTPVGFQAQVRTSGENGPYSGMWHIDAYTRGDASLHMSYRHADGPRRDRSFNCLTADDGPAIPAAPFQPRSVTGPTRRQYRLALALTGETTVWAGGPAGGLTLAANMTNQLNGIYEAELTVRFVLVASEADIIYPDAASDPFTSPNNASTSNTNLQSALTSTIGSANYDVGHVIHYTTSGNNGLAGGIGTVCGSNKGAGYSAYSNPNDPYFVIDYVSHELGHQFGGRHTQSNCGGSAGDSAAYTVEAGSGTTIMSYAGICGASYNVQSHNDPYFNGTDINQIVTYLNTTSCAASTATGNNAPTIGGLSSYAIPSRTPFTLTASATDPDGDPMTYCWEQQDGASLQPLNSDPGSGPIDRSRPGTASPSRTIPRLSTILANASDQWELLPQVARTTMNWRVTVRDNRSGGAGVNQATTTLQIVGTGPFQITAPNTSGTLSGPQTVTWDLGGSNLPPINCASVKISLSTDGGNTFPTVLAAGTPNTGSANVILPNINTTGARLKIEAVGNIFFDISNANFTIVPSTPAVGFAPGGPAVVSDASGNGNANGRVDPGESQIRLTIPVTNSGSITATGVTGTLVSNTPTVSVTTGVCTYPTLPSLASASNGTFYALNVSPSHPCGGPISLTLTLACDQGVGGTFGATEALPIGLSTGLSTPGTPVTVTYTGAAAPIPDNNAAGVNLTLPVAGVWGGGVIADLDFRFNGTACTTSASSSTVGLNHGSVGQLIVKLTSPQGTTVTLVNRMSGGGATGANSSNNFCNTVLDDSGAASIQTIAGSNAPFTGTFAPASPLSAFNGEDPTGTWTLNVADVVSGTTGTARAWSLVITPQSITTCDPPVGALGACCDASTGLCTGVAEPACTGGGGAFQGGGTACSPNPCPQPPVAITVLMAGTGTGIVTSTPAGIACGAMGGACAFDFAPGTPATLSAVATSNSVFVGWSGGGACSGSGPCSFSVVAADTITATFRCRADFNGVDGITVQDIFDYLNGWFAGDPATNVDGVPGLSVQDIFSFLNTWFAGC